MILEFVNQLPEGICDGIEDVGERCLHSMQNDVHVVGLEQIVTYVTGLDIPEIQIAPANDRIRYFHYVHKNGENIWLQWKQMLKHSML